LREWNNLKLTGDESEKFVAGYNAYYDDKFNRGNINDEGDSQDIIDMDEFNYIVYGDKA
jgi:hypothetical protein